MLSSSFSLRFGPYPISKAVISPLTPDAPICERCYEGFFGRVLGSGVEAGFSAGGDDEVDGAGSGEAVL